ncbi:hypothetical protein [Sedimenticola selenatireducens]|uniref:hypothetical protein n=1 Tax=Sedimenticola selenatireducens TaxID=191960 RepID=UPI002AAB84F3|nr:hypothetical protein [Sedimenticola selenatireducens]
MFVIAVTSDNDPPAKETTKAPPVVYDESKWHPVPPDSKVSNSPWDGSVYEIERYLEHTLKDPDSYEGIEWSQVVTKLIDGQRRYAVRHKYRAKNSFGGYVVEQVYFVMDGAGTVLSAVKL